MAFLLSKACSMDTKPSFLVSFLQMNLADLIPFRLKLAAYLTFRINIAIWLPFYLSIVSPVSP
jgi:hypothetical protein